MKPVYNLWPGSYWLQSLWKGGFMPKSLESGSACNFSDTANDTIPQPQNRSKTVEQIRWSYLCAIFVLYVLVILAAIAGTTIMFCFTKSPLSFSLLTALTPIFRARRRIENFLFPISQEDLLLEMSQQAKRGDEAKPDSLFHHLTRKLSS